MLARYAAQLPDLLRALALLGDAERRLLLDLDVVGVLSRTLLREAAPEPSGSQTSEVIAARQRLTMRLAGALSGFVRCCAPIRPASDVAREARPAPTLLVAPTDSATPLSAGELDLLLSDRLLAELVSLAQAGAGCVVVSLMQHLCWGDLAASEAVAAMLPRCYEGFGPAQLGSVTQVLLGVLRVGDALRDWRIDRALGLVLACIVRSGGRAGLCHLLAGVLVEAAAQHDDVYAWVAGHADAINSALVPVRMQLKLPAPAAGAGTPVGSGKKTGKAKTPKTPAK